VGDNASGACLLPDREWRRAGTCEWKDPMDLKRSYALSADAGEHEPAAIRTLVLKLAVCPGVTTSFVGPGAPFISFR
jgi:hypothetical protein